MNKFAVKREQRLLQLLAIGLEIFAKQGYEKTTIKMIAQQAGIALGLLYNYFPSKEELLVALIRQEQDKIYTTLLEEMHKSDLNQVDIYIRTTVKLVKQNKNFYRLLHGVRLQSEIVKQVQLDIKKDMEALQKRVELELNEAGIPFPGLEAKLLFASLDGIINHFLLNESYPVDDIANLLLMKYRNK